MKRTTSLLHRVTGATALLALVGAAGLTSVPAYAADTVAPPAPANFQISPSPVTNGGAVLTWNASTAADVAYYQIFRSPGSGAAAVNELTYLGRTQNGSVVYMDSPETEGFYQYTVVAVDTSGNASAPSSWAGVTLDLLANGEGVVTPDYSDPASATNLTSASPFAKARSVTLTWTKSASDDVWRQLVYRADGADAPKLIGYVAAGSNTFVDIMTADDTYTYHVVTQDKAGNASASSNTRQVVVDTVAPVVEITSPAMGHTYAANTLIDITADITESGSGYDAATLKYYLDGQLLSVPVVGETALANGLHTVKVEVTDQAGNTASSQNHFFIGAADGSTASPRNLTAPALTKTRTVALSWQAPTGVTVSRYLVYRVGNGTLTQVGTTQAGVRQYTDTVSTDGAFTYYVAAELAGNLISQPSNMVTVTVDTTAPTITIKAPKNGEAYDAEGTLPVEVDVLDSGSGYDAAQVKHFLDGQAFTGAEIDLALLTEGDHTFKVEATDRAGNKAMKQSKFTVGAANGDDDDDDEDDDEGDQDYADVMQLLVSLQDQIHHGHFTALQAKLRAGNIRAFALHIIKHRGKFISSDAADKLLEAVGMENLNINPNSIKDSDIEDWEDQGPKGGHGKGKR